MGAIPGVRCIQLFQRNHPDAAEVFWKDFMKEVNADALNKMLIPIYDKYYAESEIQQWIVFYQTPLGKKLILAMPQIMQESMQAGQAWGTAIAEKVFNNLRTNGYVKEQ